MESRYVLRQVFEERLRALLVEENPSEEALGAVARSFDAFAREALRAAGWPPSAKVVATILDSHTPDYYSALRGRRVTANRLLVWYAKWSVVFTSGRRSALPADLPSPPESDGVTEMQAPTLRDAVAPPAVEDGSDRPAEVWIRLNDGQVMQGFVSGVSRGSN